MHAQRGRLPLITCALAALYFVVARLSDTDAALHGATSTLWAPAGIGVAAAVLFGRRVWAGIVAGEFAASMVMQHGQVPLVSLTYGLAQATQAILAADLLAAAHFNPRLHRIRDVL